MSAQSVFGPAALAAGVEAARRAKRGLNPAVHGYGPAASPRRAMPLFRRDPQAFIAAYLARSGKTAS